MKLYLQRNSAGKKYWIFKNSANLFGVSTLLKDADNFPLNVISNVKKAVLLQLKNYPQFDGYIIHSELGKSNRKSASNTLGTITAIEYRSADDKKLYRHNFKSKPTLIATSEKKLEIVGGKYTITDRGVIG